MTDHTHERPHQPTQKKRLDAKEQGQVPRSRDLNTLLVVFSGVILLYAFSGYIAQCFATIMRDALHPTNPQAITIDVIKNTLTQTSWRASLLLVPLFFIIVVFSLLGPILIGGFSFNLNTISPKFERLNPGKGMQRLFSGRSIIELIKAFLKFAVIIGAAIVVIWYQHLPLLQLDNLPLPSALQHSMSILLFAMLVIASTLLIFSAIDVPYQLWTHLQSLKMSTQEVREEMKTSQGNPQTRKRIRQQQIEIAQNRMILEVAKANIVITNHNQHAVAIQYNQESGAAPRVVAKGTGFVAEQIRYQALAHHVHQISAPALTRSVYRFTSVHHSIPEGLFIPVAQILAYVDQLERYHIGRAPEPKLPTEFDIPSALHF